MWVPSVLFRVAWPACAQSRQCSYVDIIRIKGRSIILKTVLATGILAAVMASYATVLLLLHSSWTVTFLSQSKVPLWCCYHSTISILTLSWSKLGTLIHHLETSQLNIVLGSYGSPLYRLTPSVVTYQQQPGSLCEAERSCRGFRGFAELNYGGRTKSVKHLLWTKAGACWQCTKWQFNSVVSINPGCQESVLPSAFISNFIV